MTLNRKRFSTHQAIRMATVGIMVALLWLAGIRAIFALPRGVQDFTLTTTADFAPGTFTRTAIVNNSGGEVALQPIGTTGPWITDTQRLPGPREQLAVVSASNRIYAFGGIDNVTFLPLTQIYSTTVVSTNLTAWVTQTNSLPFGLAGHVALVAAAGGVTRIYAIGGQTGGVYSSKIFYAPIGSDGAVGTWITNSVDLPVGLNFASGVVNNGRIYIIGGIQNNLTYRPEVYYADIAANGSVGAWTATMSLPQALAYSAAVVFNGSAQDTIYVLGGATSALTNTTGVYFADVTVGGVTAWVTSTGNLPQAFSSHTAIQANDEIYIIGGNSGGVSSNLQPRQTVLTALIDESNATRRLVDLGGGQTWIETDALWVPRRFLGSAIVNSELFAIGGDSSSDAFNSAPSTITYHSPTTGAGRAYAPTGNYLSPIINTGALLPFSEFAWATVMTDVNALNVNLRYRTSTNGVSWSAWSALLPSSAVPSTNINDAKPITYPLNVTAQYFQAQAFFTSTNLALTPFLTEIHLRASVPSADLAVSKFAQASAVLPGDLITYTINYTNLVGSAVSNAILTETVPANTTFVRADIGWTQVGTSSTYVKSLGSLGVGSTGSTVFVVRVVNPPPPNTPAVYNTVMIGGDPSETNLTNNVYTATTLIDQLVPGVELRVTKDDVFIFPKAAQVLTYTITYANFGDTAAANVVLTETLPAAMTYVGSGWTAIGGNLFTRALGTVGSAGSGIVPFSAQVNPSISGGTLLTNTVQIGYPGVDVNPANNIAIDVDYIQPPNLRIFKFDNAAVVAPGQTTTYNLAVLNIGGSMATGVVITETPPLALVQVVNAPGWTQVGASWVKAFGNLAAGASLNDTFSVRVLNAAPNGSVITNTARVNASNQDPAQTTKLVAADVDFVATGAPDLKISGVNYLAAVKGITTTFNVYLTNAGNVDAATSFFTDMYVNRMPTDRSDLGDTYADSGGGLAISESLTLSYTWIFPQAGTYQIYFQVDTCDTSSIGPGGNCFDPSYGRIPELNESNNIGGPFIVTVFPTTPKQIKFPFFSR